MPFLHGVSCNGVPFNKGELPAWHQFKLHALTGFFTWLVLSPVICQGQVNTSITPTTGAGNLGTTITQGGNVYNITGGTRPGGGPNLFHSFGDFNIPSGTIGNFLNNTGLPTSNILGRVTGGNISNIFGNIETTGFSNANLFLMNPSGFVFGPTISLNVGGSVSFTTAQYIRLFDGVSSANFYANPANDGFSNSILTIDPSAFEFLLASPAAYGFLTTPDPNASITLQGGIVNSASDISLIGGKVVIQGASLPDGRVQPALLSAPNHTIQVATTASPGEFDMATLQPLPNVDGATFTSSASVTMAPGSTLDVRDGSRVFIKGGQLVYSINDATLKTTEPNFPGPPDTILLSPGSAITTRTSGTDPGADLEITVGTLLMDGAAVQTIQNGDGPGGNVNISATTVGLSNGALIQSLTGFDSTGFGNGGNVTVQGLQGPNSAADSVTLSNFASITSVTQFSGDSGQVSITAKSLNLDGLSTINSSALGDGRGGDIILSVQAASFLGGSTIISQTELLGGAGGRVIVQGLKGAGSKADSLVLAGQGSGIISTSNGGRLGDIEVHGSRSVVLTDGASIQAGTPSSSGTAGHVSIEAESVDIAGGSFISSKASLEDAGQVTITANQLTLDHGSIDTITNSSHRGGDVVLNAGSVSLTNGATITSASTGTEPFFNVDGIDPPGRAGNVSINALDSFTSDASTITTSAEANHGGDISITAPNVQLSNSVINASTNGPSQVTRLGLDETGNLVEQVVGDGGAGKITITTTGNPGDLISLASGSTIASVTTAGGNAGQVILTTPTLNVDNATITTNTSSSGNAGSITAKVGSLTLINGVEISSNSTGEATGAAGSVTIQGLTSPAAEAVTITDSALLTSAANTGQGGSITVAATTLTLNNATVSASVHDFNSGEVSDGPGVGTGNVALLGSNINVTGGTISAATSGTRNAGTVGLDAASLNIANGTVTTNTSGNGNAGAITLMTTAQPMNLTSSSIITSSTTAGGDAGQVVITTPSLNVDNATITTNTSSSGNAGSITANVGTLTLTNGAEISSNSTGEATGAAGSVTIQGLSSPANSVTVTDSSLLTSADSTGQGGSIVVDAANLSLNNATVSASVNNFNNSPGSTDGATVGLANIDLTASTMTLQGTTVTTESSGLRNAGDVRINPNVPGSSFEMQNSTINTSASLSDGGNIAINFNNMFQMTNSVVTSSVGNPHKTDTTGGNITIDPENVILQNSQIIAQAFAGTGGNISITSGVFLADPSSVVDASSALGISGTVDIRSPVSNISGVIGHLPESVLAAKALLRSACAARMGEAQFSSFAVMGRDSIPLGPAGLLATPYMPPSAGSSVQMGAARSGAALESFGTMDTVPPGTLPSLLQQGYDAFRHGAFEQAAEKWAEAVRSAHEVGSVLEESDAHVALAEAYLPLGFQSRAAQHLDLAVALARSAGDRSREAIALDVLGQAYLAAGQTDAALQALEEAQRVATDTGDPVRLATVHHTMGAVRAALTHDTEAVTSYQEARHVAKASQVDTLAATATVNLSTLALKSGQWPEAHKLFDEALPQVRALPDTHDKAYAMITIGLGYAGLRNHLPDTGDQLLVLAATVLEEAGELAKELGDARAASYAFGHRGHLYEQERRYEETLLLSRLAVGYAQQVDAPESLYRWEWQTGRVFKAQHRLDQAIAAYQRAADLIQKFRPEMVAETAESSSSFREASGGVFFELADVLLQRASDTATHEEAQPYLMQAREAAELFKTAELRDYFLDECIDAYQTRSTRLEDVSPHAAILYPIILPDHTELLVSLPDGMHRVTVPVRDEELTEEVRAFRTLLQKATSDEYLRHAQRLYDWLLRPLEPDFAKFDLDTLVVVPDGPLRMIPFAALHDGKQFVIAKYAVATSPGLNLTDPKPLARERIQVLSAGLTEGVQGFPPLPNAAEELKAIGELYKGHHLLNEDFRVPTVEQEMKENPFTIVHIASHGKFERDVKKSFVLTFDDRLTMDHLNQVVGYYRFRDQPLELLSLSACQTAVGDDRAALGMAGVAIKAGARSALATLWFINDEATSALVVEFYRQLKDPSVSKAMALRQAQLKVLENPIFQHPIYWAPFLLLNNWL